MESLVRDHVAILVPMPIVCHRTAGLRAAHARSLA
jgi:hypothetical protein